MTPHEYVILCGFEAALLRFTTHTTTLTSPLTSPLTPHNLPLISPLATHTIHTPKLYQAMRK